MIPYVQIDCAELRHTDGKLIMFLVVNRVAKFTHVDFHDKAGKMAGSDLLRNVVEVFLDQSHVLTDNGMAFADLPCIAIAKVMGHSVATSWPCLH